jgi:molecular chaperone DnaK
MGKVIGIDLGTTFSAIATVNEHGRPEIISNREGERITPSVVLFDSEMPIVGSMARRSAVASPLDVVQFVKRQMGDRTWKFRTENGDSYTPEIISAIILRRLREDAETMLGERVTDAVITVPAYFNDAQRKATLDAGSIAGLNVLRIINEPTAAALAYGFDKINQNETVLVYDLGGGTFDVTIMHVGGGEIDVISTGGDKNLGGFDWDNALMVYLDDEFQKQGGPSLFDDPATEQDLRDKAEIAKKTLSSMDKTKVFLSAGGKNIPVNVTRLQFDSLTESLVKRTKSIMEFVLEDANLTWDKIDKTLLVGGSTRMKSIPALVEKVTGKKPSMELHPDEVVAMGASIQGMLLHLKEGRGDLVERESFPIVEIKDVNSHSMGVIALDDFGRDKNVIVMQKDTAIPCKVSDIFTTVQDNQTQLLVQVTQGEEEDPQRVDILGESTLKIPTYPKGAPVEVFFEYDANGNVHVSVFDLTTNKSLGEFPIKRKSNYSEEEVQTTKQKLSKINVG